MSNQVLQLWKLVNTPCKKLLNILGLEKKLMKIIGLRIIIINVGRRKMYEKTKQGPFLNKMKQR
jgi:hypothetical protein